MKLVVTAFVAAALTVGCAAAPANPFTTHALEKPFETGGVVSERVPAGGSLYLRLRDDAGVESWVVTLSRTAPSDVQVRVTVFAKANSFTSKRLGRTFEPLLFGAVRAASTTITPESTMKRLVRSSLVLLVTACGGPMPTQFTPTITLAKGQTQLTVRIERVKGDRGPVFCDLFNAGEGFPGQSRIIGGSLRLEATSAPECAFKDVPAGSYAVSVIQDENSNGTLDVNAFGVPTEGYGISNNVLPATSAPTWKDSRFDVDGAAAVEVAVRLKN